MSPLFDANKWLFLQINAETDDHRYSILTATLIAEYLVAAMLLVLVVYLIGKHRHNKQVYIGVIASILVGISITYLIRKGIYYPRPFSLNIGTNFLEHSHSSSFPSKHQTPIFAAGVFLCLLPQTRRFGLIFLGFSFAVAWSRIYLGVHWPLDMLGALMVGLTASLLVKYSSRYLIRA